MSGIVAVLGEASATAEPAVRRMLDLVRLRGADQLQVCSGEGGVLAVGRASWELGPDIAGGVLVLEQDQLVVAADASLYYRDDLLRALRQAGETPAGISPSHLIAAAYRAWGPEGVASLEGDFAFVLWDRQRRLLLAARDLAGSRPLYFAQAGARLILASSLTAVAAHPAVSRELNPLALAEDLIAASSMAVRETAFRNVERVPAGFLLRWQPGGTPRLEEFWKPPLFEQGVGPDAAEAAGELRDLLRAAVAERMAVMGRTSVWMSGGYDSPAVFALAREVSRQPGRGAVLPVSMSYPEGDPGREDELIQRVAGSLGAEVRWVPIASVPGWLDPAQWAARRDEPTAHPYEQWNRALARATLAINARIALTGNGGDQFFSVSPVFLADLLRAGRWGALAHEAEALGLGLRRFRDLFHWSVQPALPPVLQRLATWVRGGRPLRAHLQARLPPWFRTDRIPASRLWERQWQYSLRRPGESFGSAEAVWYLRSGFGQRIVSMATSLAQQEGVEARSPMYDRRVIDFIARRPRQDRFAAGQSKRLLRQALTGVLPPEHLAPRARRTGLPSGYLRRCLTESLPGWFASVQGDLRVADLGLVEPRLLRATLERYLANPQWESISGVQVFDVLALEHWIRVQSEVGTRASAMVA